MIKLLTICLEGTPNAVCAKECEDRFVVEKEYSDEEYKAIRQEADEYEIYIYSTWGEDYGYGRENSSTREGTNEIKDCQIVVSNDGPHFAGVADISDYYEFNKSAHYEKGLQITLIDDPVDRWRGYPLISKSGNSFSSDDHEKWDFTYYYLRKK